MNKTIRDILIIVFLFILGIVLTAKPKYSKRNVYVGDMCIGAYMYHVNKQGHPRQLLTSDGKGIPCGDL